MCQNTGCNSCQQNNSNCGCSCNSCCNNNCDGCVEQACSCDFEMDTSCIRYSGPELECIDVTPGETLEQSLQNINDIMCSVSSGLDGEDGDSAYEIWVNLGNDGTEQDFIDGLKGADGADGIDGIDGIDGGAGNAGVDGTNGLDGQSIDHVSFTFSSLGGIAAQKGATDTYTQWGDVAEIINLGTFEVYNGEDGVDGATGPAGADGTPDTNFAINDLTFTANRTHDLATFNLALVNGNVGIGAAPALLTKFDIRAVGTTISDIHARVRNSANTYNIFTIAGESVWGSGKGGIDTNTSYGKEALNSNTTGTNSTANGFNALKSNTAGSFNTANGSSTLFSNTTGANNTANGHSALFSNTTGSFNTANGQSALFSNTTGANNTANGGQALLSNTTGSQNTANGVEALENNTTGSFNTANGQRALQGNTTGLQNTANGSQALQNNTIGVSNTASGFQALFSNTTGIQNTSNGHSALLSNTTGSDNTANGFQALYNNTTGQQNTASGLNAGRLISGGAANTITDNSVYIGWDTRALADNQTNQIVIGHNARGLGSNTTVLGNSSQTLWKAWGAGALENIATPTGIVDNFHIYSADQVAGNAAPHFRTELGQIVKLYTEAAVTTPQGIADALTAQGLLAASTITVSADTNFANTNLTFDANRTHDLATFDLALNNGNVGIGAAPAANTKFDVRAQGALITDIHARVRNSADTYNVFTIAGESVWGSGKGGIDTNTSYGKESLNSNTTGVDNTANGASALFSNTTGDVNTAIGKEALFSNTTGVQNTANGNRALFNSTIGDANTAIGLNAGRYISTGFTANTITNNSVYLGYQTRALADNQTNQIVIGFDAVGLGSNTATLGNNSITLTQLKGNVVSGTQVAIATTATDGFLYIPTCAGVPTGVPTAITGKSPLVVDSTNNKMYFYSGGAWQILN